ncbi:hypothetical protein KCU60_g65, partial [Aureobasidium melanogenum]
LAFIRREIVQGMNNLFCISSRIARRANGNGHHETTIACQLNSSIGTEPFCRVESCVKGCEPLRLGIGYHNVNNHICTASILPQTCHLIRNSLREYRTWMLKLSHSDALLAPTMITLLSPTTLKVRTVSTLPPQATDVHLSGCTLLMITYSWNARQRARLAQVNFSGAENAKLAATISFKKRDYLPTIHKELRDHLMKLMVFIITTKGYDITSEDNDEVKFTKLTAKIDVRELNYILKTTLRGVKTFDNDEVEEEFAEATLNVWGVLGFERVLMTTAKLHVLSSKGDGHAYWDLIAPEGLTGELMLLRALDGMLFFATLIYFHPSYTQSILVRRAMVFDDISGVVHMAERADVSNAHHESQQLFLPPSACLLPIVIDLSCSQISFLKSRVFVQGLLCVLSARINSLFSRGCRISTGGTNASTENLVQTPMAEHSSISAGALTTGKCSLNSYCSKLNSSTGSATTEAVPQTQCPIFLLPAELRKMIYGYVFVNGTIDKKTLSRVYTIGKRKQQRIQNLAVRKNNFKLENIGHHHFALLKTCRAIYAECKPFFESKAVYRSTSPLAIAGFLCGGNLDWPQFSPRDLDVLDKAHKVQVVVDPAQNDSPYPCYPFEIVLRSMYELKSSNEPRGLGLTFIDQDNTAPRSTKIDGRTASKKRRLVAHVGLEFGKSLITRFPHGIQGSLVFLWTFSWVRNCLCLLIANKKLRLAVGASTQIPLLPFCLLLLFLLCYQFLTFSSFLIIDHTNVVRQRSCTANATRPTSTTNTHTTGIQKRQTETYAHADEHGSGDARVHCGQKDDASKGDEGGEGEHVLEAAKQVAEVEKGSVYGMSMWKDEKGEVMEQPKSGVSERTWWSRRASQHLQMIREDQKEQGDIHKLQVKSEEMRARYTLQWERGRLHARPPCLPHTTASNQNMERDTNRRPKEIRCETGTPCSGKEEEAPQDAVHTATTMHNAPYSKDLPGAPNIPTPTFKMAPHYPMFRSHTEHDQDSSESSDLTDPWPYQQWKKCTQERKDVTSPCESRRAQGGRKRRPVKWFGIALIASDTLLFSRCYGVCPGSKHVVVVYAPDDSFVKIIKDFTSPDGAEAMIGMSRLLSVKPPATLRSTFPSYKEAEDFSTQLDAVQRYPHVLTCDDEKARALGFANRCRCQTLASFAHALATLQTATSEQLSKRCT